MASGVATSSSININNQGTPQPIQSQDDGLIPLSTGTDTSRLSQGTSSSAAPSPILSPQGKTFGRNINGTSEFIFIFICVINGLEGVEKQNFPSYTVFIQTELTIIIRHNISIEGNGFIVVAATSYVPTPMFFAR